MNEQKKQKALNILGWIDEIIHLITSLFKRKRLQKQENNELD